MASTLDIHEQPRLSIVRQIEICLDGIHHRLFRSLVTLSVVVLAVAFLMNVLAESVLAGSLKRGVFALEAESSQLRRFEQFFHMSPDEAGIRKRLVAAEPGTWRAATLRHWLTMGPAEFDALRRRVMEAAEYEVWLDALSMGHRRLLLEGREGEAALAWLATETGQAHFRKAIADLPTLSAPAGLLRFAAEHDTLRNRLDRAADAFAARRHRFEQALAPHALAERLAAALDVEAQRTLHELLTAHAVSLSEARLRHLAARAHEREVERQLVNLLDHPVVAEAWHERFGSVLNREDALAVLAVDTARRQWLARQAREGDSLDEPPTVAQIAAAAQRLIDTRRLTELATQLRADYGETEGMGANIFWLIIVSLLVCVVGVTNAMLVSVLERFREIATMKCLGALNGFIAVLFLMEAALLGLVGGVMGVLLGFVIGLARMFAGYGDWVLRYADGLDLLGAGALSAGAGLLLAALAAIYPAWIASRMPPMEAMRVE
ncbi:MAG: ABC transporter permease [Phycisphaeraceae bacterium]